MAFTNIPLFISEIVTGIIVVHMGLPWWLRLGSIPGLGRYVEEGNGYLLQYSCLGNPMDREAWWATVHGVSRSPRHKTGQSDEHYQQPTQAVNFYVKVNETMLPSTGNACFQSLSGS